MTMGGAPSTAMPAQGTGMSNSCSSWEQASLPLTGQGVPRFIRPRPRSARAMSVRLLVPGLMLT